MTCSHIESLITAYADNELPQDNKEEVQKHLETCSACRILFDCEIASKKAIRSIRITQAPPHLRHNIIALIREGAAHESEKIAKVLSFFRFFKQNIAYASAAVILIFIGLFFTVTHLFMSSGMSPFIGSVYAYHAENDFPIDIKGTPEDIEKILSQTLHKDIPIPALDDIDLSLLGASNHTDVKGRQCAAIKYKRKDGREVSHFVICCMKVPISSLEAVENKPEYFYASKNGLSMIFWRCEATKTTRCIAANCSIEELITITDLFRAEATEHFNKMHLKTN